MVLTNEDMQPVFHILEQIGPYLGLKKPHFDVARKIAELLPRYQRLNKSLLLEVGQYIDRFKQLNYSKRRRNTTSAVQAFFDTPRND